MGRLYIYLYLVDFYGFHVAKYTVRPMDPSWVYISISMDHDDSMDFMDFFSSLDD